VATGLRVLAARTLADRCVRSAGRENGVMGEGHTADDPRQDPTRAILGVSRHDLTSPGPGVSAGLAKNTPAGSRWALADDRR
jgi:hypothetical protein